MISHYSIKAHTFAQPGVNWPTLEDVVALTCLQMFRKANFIKIVLGKADEKKIDAQNNTFSRSKH